MRLTFTAAWALAWLVASPIPAAGSGGITPGWLALPFLTGLGAGLLLPSRAVPRYSKKGDLALLAVLAAGTLALERIAVSALRPSSPMAGGLSSILPSVEAGGYAVPAVGAILGVAAALYLHGWLERYSSLPFPVRASAIGFGLAGAHLLAAAAELDGVAGRSAPAYLFLFLAAAATIGLPDTPPPGHHPDGAVMHAARAGEPLTPAGLRRPSLVYAATLILYAAAGIVLAALWASASRSEASLTSAPASGTAPDSAAAGHAIWALGASLAGWQLRESTAGTLLTLGIALLGASWSLLQAPFSSWAPTTAYLLMQAGLALVTVPLGAEFAGLRLRGVSPATGRTGLACMALGAAGGILAAATVGTAAPALEAHPGPAPTLALLGLFLALALGGMPLARRPLPSFALDAAAVSGPSPRSRAPGREAAVSRPSFDAPSHPTREDAKVVLRAFGLTPREQEVALRLVYDKMVLKDIAAALYITRNTLRTHLRHIYEKCGVRGRDELAALLARQLGQADPPSPAPAPSASRREPKAPPREAAALRASTSLPDKSAAPKPQASKPRPLGAEPRSVPRA